MAADSLGRVSAESQHRPPDSRARARSAHFGPSVFQLKSQVSHPHCALLTFLTEGIEEHKTRLFHVTVEGKSVIPQKANVLIPTTRENGTFCGEGDFANVMEAKHLILGYQGHTMSSKGPCREEAGGSEQW